MAETSQAAEALTQAKQPPKEKGKPVYEIGFHIVPTVGEEGVPKVLDKIRAALGDSEIIGEKFPEKMTLSYQVERATQGKRDKYTQAYFGWVKFAADRETIVPLQEALRANKDILRFILIETVREEIVHKQRAVFVSDRLEGKTLEKPTAPVEKVAEVSEAELDKSIEALTG